MPDLGDFYAFKMTSSGSGSGGGKNNASNNGSSGYSTTLIVLAVIGWVLWFVGKFLS